VLPWQYYINYNVFFSKARVSACMYFLVLFTSVRFASSIFYSLITSTFNGLQIQSNLGTTALFACDVPRWTCHIQYVPSAGPKLTKPAKASQLYSRDLDWAKNKRSGTVIGCRDHRNEHANWFLRSMEKRLKIPLRLNYQPVQ
jgi:hypothetical protein